MRSCLWMRFGAALVLGIAILAAATPSAGWHLGAGRAAEIAVGSPVASPLAETGCPGADLYLQSVQTVADGLRGSDALGLFDEWEAAASGDLTGHEWRTLSDRYRDTHAEWLNIEAPSWADPLHTTVDAYFGLLINASLAASTRGVYAMGAYEIVIKTAEQSVTAELVLLYSLCPVTASALAQSLGVELPKSVATPTI